MATTPTEPNENGPDNGQQQHPQKAQAADPGPGPNIGKQAIGVKPTIQCVCTSENPAITRTDNHLDNTNYCMTSPTYSHAPNMWGSRLCS